LLTITINSKLTTTPHFCASFNLLYLFCFSFLRLLFTYSTAITFDEAIHQKTSDILCHAIFVFKSRKVYERKNLSTQGKAETTGMNVTKFKAKAIFFDLDGTIVDSREAYYEAARTAFQAMGQEPPETALEIPRRLEQKQPINDIIKGDTRRFLDVYLKAYYSVTEVKTRLLPNVSTMLELLSVHAKLALITMRAVPKESIIKELDRFGVAKCFNYVVTALDTRKPKPSPEALMQCVKALDVQICDCVIVGDSINDVKAGKAAGAITVAVLSGLFSREEVAEEHPDLIIKDATALPNFVE
jgi:phosphoglycolate phosphatase